MSDNTTNAEAFEREALARGVVLDFDADYEEWLEETGLDDSFVGSPEAGIPGTHDLYEAAARIYQRENAGTPTP